MKRRDSEEPALPAPGPVTALREDARRAGRYAIQLGDATIAPLSVETISDLALGVGTVLDAPTLARVLDARATTACYDHAIDALARRARSTRGLERWLAERDHPAAAISAAIDRLTALGLLDDEAFARSFARSRAVGKGMGPRRIAAELARHGVPRRTVDLVLQEQAARAEEEAESGLSRAERERVEVRAIAARRVRSLASLEPEVARRRLAAWLVRRGHAPVVCAQVVRELLPR